MGKIYKYSLKHILVLVLISTLILLPVNSETYTLSSNQKSTATKKPKALTPKKYRKNFVIRIQKTIFKSNGPKRITTTRTTPPASIEYEIPTHTSEETTSYYSTYGYDFISPSPEPSRVFRRKKPRLETKNI